MAELKTKKTDSSVSAFLAKIKDPQRLKDCKTLVTLMSKASGAKPKLWGSSIVGFGDWHVKGKSREVDWFRLGFSPRKGDLSLYLTLNLDSMAPELEKLGRHKRGKGCLYLRTLADVDLKILESMFAKSLRQSAPR